MLYLKDYKFYIFIILGIIGNLSKDILASLPLRIMWFMEAQDKACSLLIYNKMMLN